MRGIVPLPFPAARKAHFLYDMFKFEIFNITFKIHFIMFFVKVCVSDFEGTYT